MKTNHKWLAFGLGAVTGAAILGGALSIREAVESGTPGMLAEIRKLPERASDGLQNALAKLRPADPPKEPDWIAGNNLHADIFRRMDAMSRDMDRLLAERIGASWPAPASLFSGGEFAMAMDLSEDDKEYTVRVELPGRTSENVDVKVDDYTLSVSAREEDSGKNDTPYSRSVSYTRSMTLPGPVDAAAMKVDKETNAVTIRLPKATSR